MQKLLLAILLSCGMVAFIGCGGAAEAEGPVDTEQEKPEGLEEDIMDDYKERGVDPSGGRMPQQ